MDVDGPVNDWAIFYGKLRVIPALGSLVEAIEIGSRFTLIEDEKISVKIFRGRLIP